MTAAVKKSIVGMLSSRLEGAVAVDLYCGTGSMGLEAVSAGASRCYFADRDRTVLRRLARNIEALGAKEACTVWRGDGEQRLAGWIGRLDVPVDIAFVDPPYSRARRWNWSAVEARIFAPLAEHLADDGLVVLRLPRGVDCPPALGGLTTKRSRTYGDMVVEMLAKTEG